MNPLPFEIPPDVLSFLQLVITPTFGAWFISAFAEQEEWFQKLTTAWKSRAIFIMLLALSVFGRIALATASGGAVTIQDIYLGFAVAFVSYVSSKWYHVKTNDPTPYTSKERAATVSIKATVTEQPKLDGAPQAAA